ncbi:MAG TPA: hypothetical protein ENG14_00460 [Thermodesulforhabdus norvegica]|uniref:Uncharacterized protein n=1 Tax=Thermodesulforhabdus norvegica TaxID=39841 RepID=A0A7C1AV54_9BACT|nr:hypothetical protein [Deltaproteobacteria bacterium]MBW2067947.1 hypothetical protein [Deltaproteobacteria bacterium]HDL89358.1 hypothetical protein [Thermodesulforhabdus norvegica]
MSRGFQVIIIVFTGFTMSRLVMLIITTGTDISSNHTTIIITTGTGIGSDHTIAVVPAMVAIIVSVTAGLLIGIIALTGYTHATGRLGTAGI